MIIGNAHLVAGGSKVLPALRAEIEKDLADVGVEDMYMRAYVQFGVDDARELIERASTRPLAGQRRVFILAMPDMTAEAQNALLKTLEEPPADAVFFFVLPAPQMLLPTLRSRMQIRTAEGGTEMGKVDAVQFLAAPPSKRLEMLRPLIEKEGDEARDVSGIVTFLSSLERILSKRVRDTSVRRGIEAIYRARTYAGDKGSHLKSLLEQVALLTPVI